MFLSILKERKLRRMEKSDLEYVPLVPPGRIVHLVKTFSSSNRIPVSPPSSRHAARDTDRYKPIWASNEDFCEIQITNTFMADHFPATVCQELERLAESFGLEPPYYLPPEE
jgi:hypothetical protein